MTAPKWQFSDLYIAMEWQFSGLYIAMEWQFSGRLAFNKNRSK